MAQSMTPRLIREADYGGRVAHSAVQRWRLTDGTEGAGDGETEAFRTPTHLGVEVMLYSVPELITVNPTLQQRVSDAAAFHRPPHPGRPSPPSAPPMAALYPERPPNDSLENRDAELNADH
ncbi:hypothetical protein EYF80_038225 [Liparis tanakae]|uniref:Uncharacterized protein n=1 Tax=Liparis tanakae TaxID=230148 RepID=A0A4Z2GDC7_9TELE|nr:hypothetical protein EYF80_038225 [Liparis tanakae]